MYDTCVAVDWEPSNAEQSCWILTSTETGDSTDTGVITHYVLNRPSESRFCFTRLAIRLLHRVAFSTRLFILTNAIVGGGNCTLHFVKP